MKPLVCVTTKMESKWTTANKEKKIQATAFATVEAVIMGLNKYAVGLVTPILVDSLGKKCKPEQKVCALKMMATLVAAHPQIVSRDS